MFFKEDIKQVFNKLEIDVNDYILLMGGALVIHGIRETAHDLDIALSKVAFNEISQGKQISKAKWTGDNKIDLDEMEFFEHKHLHNTPSILINGIRVQTINSIIEWKRNGGREKDKRDIELILKHKLS